MSDTHVAFSDFSEDPDGRFDEDETDLADVVVVERATGATRKRALPGKQAFPMLASASELGYLSWRDVHPEPKLTAFDLVAGRIDGDGTLDVRIATVRSSASVYIRPAARAGVFEWIERADGKATLLRASLTRPTPAPALAVDGLDLYAPAATLSFTVLASRSTAASPATLQVVAR